MKPTNGSWFPAKARGGGNVSVPPGSSFISSSKLLVSISLLSSGTTGAMAERQRETEKGGSRGEWGNIVKDLSKNSVSCLSLSVCVCVWASERLTVKGSVCVAHKADTVLKGGVARMICQAGRCLLTTYCAYTRSRSLTHPKHSLVLELTHWACWENICQTSNGDRAECITAL